VGLQTKEVSGKEERRGHLKKKVEPARENGTQLRIPNKPGEEGGKGKRIRREV